MATKADVPVEVYLRCSDYEPDAEYVNGQIEERPMGQFDHADWQQAIVAWFNRYGKEWGVRALPELRVRVAEDIYRVPDVTVLDRSQPREQIVTVPPAAVFEVLSPEDRVLRMKRKLADYSSMGIEQIWVVDPADGSWMRYTVGQLSPQTTFETRGIKFDLSKIAEMLLD